MDLVVREGARLWWLDFTCFHPFSGAGSPGTRQSAWSLQHRERDKHATYRVRVGGRRIVANGQVVPIAANSYAALGKEATGFFSMVSSVARRLGRDSAAIRLEPIVQSLVVFFVASGVVQAYRPKPE